MGLRYALLFACFATVCCVRWHWTTRLAAKNPENSAILNSEELGHFQDAWKSIEQTANSTYVLMFRSKFIRQERDYFCVYLSAHITDPVNKTANYTRTYYDYSSEKYMNETFHVRALKQTGYSLENVLRQSLDGEIPSDNPIPKGINTYIQYNNYSCDSSYTPLWDVEGGGESGENVESFARMDPMKYRDMYVVYSEPKCHIYRIPLLEGGCDFWLRESELQSVLQAVENEKDNKTEEEDKKEEDYWRKHWESQNCTSQQIERFLRVDREYRAEKRYKNAVFKNLPSTCRLAFLTACEKPREAIYDPITCNKSRTIEAVESGQN